MPYPLEGKTLYLGKWQEMELFLIVYKGGIPGHRAHRRNLGEVDEHGVIPRHTLEAKEWSGRKAVQALFKNVNIKEMNRITFAVATNAR